MLLVRNIFLLIALAFYCAGRAQVKMAPLQITSVDEELFTLGNPPVECEASGLSELDTLGVIEIIYNHYPFIKGRDTALVNRINRQVLGYLIRDGERMNRKKMKFSNCSEDRPSSVTTTYSVFCLNNHYLNLCLFQDIEPYGLGNGFAHYAFPICFDLIRKQPASLSDLLLPQAWDKLIDRMTEELIKNYPDMFLGDDQAQTFKNARENLASNWTYVFDNKALYFFITLHFGGKVTYEKFTYAYSSEPAIFRPDFLLQWK